MTAKCAKLDKNSKREIGRTQKKEKQTQSSGQYSCCSRGGCLNEVRVTLQTMCCSILLMSTSDSPRILHVGLFNRYREERETLVTYARLRIVIVIVCRMGQTATSSLLVRSEKIESCFCRMYGMYKPIWEGYTCTVCVLYRP
jgi:hypothetical protein